VRRESKIGILRFITALIAGPFLSFAFVFAFAALAPQSLESMGEFVGSILGLGFEGAFATLVIIVAGIALIFSVLCWFVMRSWGPLRHRIGDPVPGSHSS
jgi:hypothetical protein